MKWNAPIRFQGTACELNIGAPASGIVVLAIHGHDVGEFGASPMNQLESYLSTGQPVELFIDARDTKGASMEVSSGWAQWLAARRTHFSSIHMLVGSRFVYITADFVRSFSKLEGLMRIYTDAAAFDETLERACSRPGAKGP